MLVILILALTLAGQVHAGKISGGHEAVPHSRPYMVIVERNQNANILYCGGFLLNEDFVMTAAHCQAEFYTVFLGVHDINNKKEVQNICVEQAFPHKDYNETDYRNDIMLLKLSSKANFSKNVKPIELADQGGDSLPKSCLVSGWGKTDSGTNYMSFKLMEVSVTLIRAKQCERINMYCSEGKTGPRKGDSGGPLVCEDGKAYGVVSFSIQPNQTPIYAFAKIPDNRNWIDSTMKEASDI